MAQNNIISLTKIVEQLGLSDKKKHESIKILDNTLLKVVSSPKAKYYIAPHLSEIQNGKLVPLKDAEILCISAAGATGKTSMAEYLSNTYNIPLLDVSKKALGESSLSGILMDCVEPSFIGQYKKGLNEGTCQMIIDGLDEAANLITEQSMWAFLDDVIKNTNENSKISYIILGRTIALQDAVQYLSQKRKVAYYMIEPFTIDEANDFIDKEVGDYIDRHNVEYNEVKKYILQQIEGFFNYDETAQSSLFTQFIGYAPVLYAISTLLKHKNYANLKNQLTQSHKKNIELIIEIIGYILERESKKIEPAIEHLLQDRDASFTADVKRHAYNMDEQCVRILNYILGEDVQINISSDEEFNKNYNRAMNQWLQEHPFINQQERTIQNVVFESYMIAKLIDSPAYRDYVYLYLSEYKGGAYLLIGIYNTLHSKEMPIDIEFVPYLLESFYALQKGTDKGVLEIDSESENRLEDGSVRCELSFIQKDVKDDCFHFVAKAWSDSVLHLPSNLYGIYIDAPIKVDVNPSFGTKTIRLNNVELSCSELSLMAEEYVFANVDADNYIRAKILSVTYPAKFFGSGKLVISTESQLSYPFTTFSTAYVDASTQFEDELMLQKYLKLHRILLQFRSHSKGKLAKYKDKIDNYIGNTSIGSAIIQKLLSTQVMYEDGVMYFISYDKLASVLGVKYDDIRTNVISSQIRSFLQDIKI